MKNRKIRISVIVLNWNGKNLLRKCLESLEEQTFDSFETIVVDNGSTDGSVNYLRQTFPRCKVIQLGENRGFAGGNNAGFEIAEGEYIALLNNDTELDKRWVEEISSALDRNPECGLAASKILHFDKRNIIDTAGDCLTVAGTLFKRGYRELDNDNYNQEIKVFSACAAACMYRKDMLLEVGLFDSDFFNTFEDMDLSFRGQLLGYQCVYVPTAIVYHMVTATIERNSDFHVFHSQRNIEFVLLKNLPLGLLLLTLPVRLIYEVAACTYFVKVGRFKTFFRAKVDALKYFPIMIRKRRRIQRTRRVKSGYILSQMHLGMWVRAMWDKFWLD